LGFIDLSGILVFIFITVYNIFKKQILEVVCPKQQMLNAAQSISREEMHLSIT
jgi:hypothetical protein